MFDIFAGRRLDPFLNGLSRSVFVRNVAVLMSGSVVAQILVVAAAPILTRLYHPDAFGALGLFVAGSQTLTIAASWTYGGAIVLAKDARDAANVMMLSCCIVAFMTVLSGIVIALTGESIVQLLNSPALGPLLWWIPAAVFAGGLFRVFGNWATRQKNYKMLSISGIVRAGGAVGIQLVAGLTRAEAVGLVVGNVAGQFFAFAILARQIYRDDRNMIRRAVNITKIKEMVREYYRFPIYTMPQSLLCEISQNIPTVLFAYYFDPSIAGLYWFARRLLQTPIAVIGEAARRVFYQHISEVHNSGGDLLPHFTRVTLVLAAIGIVPVIVILGFGPTLFVFFFGPDWYQAGVYARWLIVGWFFLFINVPSIVLVLVTRRQHLLLLFDIGALILRTGAIVLGASLGNDVVAIASFSIVGAILDFALVTYMFNVAKRENVPVDLDGAR